MAKNVLHEMAASSMHSPATNGPAFVSHVAMDGLDCVAGLTRRADQQGGNGHQTQAACLIIESRWRRSTLQHRGAGRSGKRDRISAGFAVKLDVMGCAFVTAATFCRSISGTSA